MTTVATANPKMDFPAAEMQLEGSWGVRSLGAHASSMEMFPSEDGSLSHSMIEWDIPTLEETEHIGLQFSVEGDKRTLIDYDGVFSLPKEAVTFMESLGIIVPDDYKD